MTLRAKRDSPPLPNAAFCRAFLTCGGLAGALEPYRSDKGDERIGY